MWPPLEAYVVHRLPIAVATLLLTALLAPTAFAAERASVARPVLPGASATAAPGLVFFLRASSDSTTVVAVGTAHTLPLERITAAPRVEFFTGRTRRRIATSRRFLAEPGTPFNLPGATLEGDTLVYALDRVPRGVEILRAAEAPVPVGGRVKILGVPQQGSADQSVVTGRVATRAPGRLEVDLDLAHDLRGWGGAPILSASNGRVVGILQAHVPQAGTSRVFAAPIRGVVEALASPLRKGAGAPFSAFKGAARAQPAARARDVASSGRSRSAASTPRRGSGPSDTSDMQMSIEYPPPGARVASSVCGVFVAGHASALRNDTRLFDVVIAIDTSRSTLDPSGADINGNGVVGASRLGRLGSLFGSSSTDPGDSILATEVAAARQILDGLDPRNTRAALVAFAGDPPGTESRSRSAFTLEPLTVDYLRIHQALDAILVNEPEGSTHMAAGVDQAALELVGAAGAPSRPDAPRERIIFFFTDGQPTLPYGDAAEADNVRAVLRAANRARRNGIRVHTFAIGPDALEGPIAVVELASRTDGYFTPVRHPGDLQNVVEEVHFANLDLSLTNETMREPARYFRSTVDGSWAGLIPMSRGPNRVRAWARADDGAEIAQLREVHLDPDVESPPIPKQLAFRRNRLLEDCLRDAKRRRRNAELLQAEEVRRDLMLEIERERERARLRADEQRKELQLEGDLE